jgi:hypothetical protein
LNNRIGEAMESYRQSKQPSGEPHAPGWFRNRISYADPNVQFSASTDWDGHQFCEKDIHSLNDPSIWFIPWSGEDAPANASPSVIQADKDTCAQDARYDHDVFAYNCSMVIDLAKPGANQDIKVVLPEAYAKVFHPRTNGHTALMYMANSAMVEMRPAERGQPACSGPIQELSSNLTIQGNNDGSPVPPQPQCTQPSTTGAGGMCHIYVQEKLTCASDPAANLCAYVKLEDSTGNSIGESGDSDVLGPEIGANSPYNLQSTLPHPITITGEHTNDYVQFNYNGLQWQSGDQQNGDKPYCDTQPWSQNSGCTGGLAGDITYVVSVCFLLICYHLLFLTPLAYRPAT